MQSEELSLLVRKCAEQSQDLVAFKLQVWTLRLSRLSRPHVLNG